MAYNFFYLKFFLWLNKRDINLKFDISTRVSLFHNALEMLQRRNQFEANYCFFVYILCFLAFCSLFTLRYPLKVLFILWPIFM
jgi:hypothetical protein